MEPSCEHCGRELTILPDYSGEGRAAIVCFDCDPPLTLCGACVRGHPPHGGIMKNKGFSDHGIPILTLDDKINALKSCLTMPCDGIREDAMGHLMDLIYHIAPGWEFGPFLGIEAIAAYYGKHPMPISGDDR